MARMTWVMAVDPEYVWMAGKAVSGHSSRSIKSSYHAKTKP
jgi:hypothetical protein